MKIYIFITVASTNQDPPLVTIGPISGQQDPGPQILYLLQGVEKYRNGGEGNSKFTPFSQVA